MLVYVFNFIDRQILSLLNKDIKTDPGLPDAQMGVHHGTAREYGSLDWFRIAVAIGAGELSVSSPVFLMLGDCFLAPRSWSKRGNIPRVVDIATAQ